MMDNKVMRDKYEHFWLRGEKKPPKKPDKLDLYSPTDMLWKAGTSSLWEFTHRAWALLQQGFGLELSAWTDLGKTDGGRSEDLEQILQLGQDTGASEQGQNERKDQEKNQKNQNKGYRYLNSGHLVTNHSQSPHLSAAKFSTQYGGLNYRTKSFSSQCFITSQLKGWFQDENTPCVFKKKKNYMCRDK